jgi:tetratricopeptide (TPR) repeat protein
MKMLLLLPLCLCLIACAPPGVPIADLLPVQEELANQAGTAYPSELLLGAMDRAHPTPAQRAEIARRRCGMAWAMRGAPAALLECRAAARMGAQVGGKAQHRGMLRLALALADAGEGRGALQLAQGLRMPVEPIDRALVWWARGLAQLAQRQDAEKAMVEARSAVEEAVRQDPKKAEFLAIADLRLGQALSAVGEGDRARAALRSALERQRGLDAANGEYAEYRLYLVRILRALGSLPGEEAAREEGRRLARALLDRDPLRVEYQIEAR